MTFTHFRLQRLCKYFGIGLYSVLLRHPDNHDTSKPARLYDLRIMIRKYDSQPYNTGKAIIKTKAYALWF